MENNKRTEQRNMIKRDKQSFQERLDKMTGEVLQDYIKRNIKDKMDYYSKTKRR